MLYFMILLLFISLLYLECWGSGQLIVHYKNKGDEIIKEIIKSDARQESISISFQLSDGTLIKQLIDYKNELQIFKLKYLPERILNESAVKEFCFITAFKKHNMISPDAVSKLRQKNPNAIRRVEEVMSTEVYSMDRKLSRHHLNFISPLPHHYCSSAQQIYAKEANLKSQLSDPGSMKQDTFLAHNSSSKLCSLLSRGRWCLCQVRVCIGWFPCGLKYCKGKDFSNKLVTYRCGIRACEKCHDLAFVERFELCPTSATQRYTNDAGFL